MSLICWWLHKCWSMWQTHSQNFLCIFRLKYSSMREIQYKKIKAENFNMSLNVPSWSLTGRNKYIVILEVAIEAKIVWVVRINKSNFRWFLDVLNCVEKPHKSNHRRRLFIQIGYIAHCPIFHDDECNAEQTLEAPMEYQSFDSIVGIWMLMIITSVRQAFGHAPSYRTVVCNVFSTDRRIALFKF